MLIFRKPLPNVDHPEMPADVVIEPRELAELIDRVQPPDGPSA